MTDFVNRVFENETVNLDGNSFVDCVMKDCVCVFSGGDMPRLQGNDFIDSRFELHGAANRTLAFLRGFIREGGVMRDIVLEQLGVKDGSEP